MPFASAATWAAQLAENPREDVQTRFEKKPQWVGVGPGSAEPAPATTSRAAARPHAKRATRVLFKILSPYVSPAFDATTKS